MGDMKRGDIDGSTLDRLFAVVASRRDADPTASYTAKLLSQGKDMIARKLGEEAVETGIEIVKGDKQRLVAESADLLYHLLVAWEDAGIAPAEVWRALEQRQGQSGLAEKAARARS